MKGKERERIVGEKDREYYSFPIRERKREIEKERERERDVLSPS